MKYYLILFLLCISQMNYDVEHISILLSVYFSLLSACSSLPSFFHYFYFLLLNSKWFLSMLKSNYCQIYILQIFYSAICFSIFLNMFLLIYLINHFEEGNILTFSFIVFALCDLRNISLLLSQKHILHYFPLKGLWF